MFPPALPATSAIVDALALEPNPQGGWFRSVQQVDAPDGGRPVASVINYLLDATAPIASFHRMSADAVHYFHRGGSLAIITISSDGVLDRAVLGADLAAGERLQVAVPGGSWKAFELIGGPWALISEAVAPGWVPDDQERATSALYERDLPHLRAEIERFVAA